MRGQLCRVPAPQPWGRSGDGRNVVFLETSYRAFKCWPEGSRRGARAGGGTAAAGSGGQPCAPGPRPGSQRALAAPPRWPGQEALQAPSAWEETRAGPQEAASPPLRSQAARLGCGGRGSPQALPSFEGVAARAGGPWLWLWSWRPPRWRSGRCSRLASCARSLGTGLGPTHLLAGLPGGEEAGCTLGHQDPSPGAGHLLQSEVALLRPDVYLQGKG